MSNYKDMSNDELEALINELRAQQRELKSRKMAIQEEIDRRKAQEKVAGLTDREKSALLQTLQAEGVPSGEAVGIPGE